MRVRFWGTRGSLPVPGPSTIRYGGNTSCVQVESDAGDLVVIDCGSGAQALGRALTADGRGPRDGTILFSHTHWDHIQGFPFFAPLFVEGGHWDVYGPRGLGESLRDALSGQMQYTYFPITLDALGAELRYHHLVEGSFRVGDIEIEARYLNHPVLTLGYRLHVDGATLVYACDHEPFRRSAADGEEALKGKDKDHADFAAGADLLIHDAQYTAAEYPHRIGWGHSPMEYAMRVAGEGGVHTLALSHHEPTRSDEELATLEAGLRERAKEHDYPGELIMATEGTVLELRGDAEKASSPDIRATGSQTPSDQAAGSALREDRSISGHRLIVALPPSRDAEIVKDVATSDGAEVRRRGPGLGDEARVAPGDPSLVIVSTDPEGLETARRIARLEEEWTEDATVVAVADEAGEDDAVDDWLIRPFSPEYAKTRIRGWLLGTPVRWVTAPATENEAERQASLDRLGVVDTESEERFDRITRLAAALLGVPVSLVTFIDDQRQWFKSAEGVDMRETSRDAALCAHTILGDEMMVVPDATVDDRFADNPMVTGPAHLRFYAGYPLRAPDGHRVGSLCVIDRRARDLSPRDRALLRDLAHLAEEELARTLENGVI